MSRYVPMVVLVLIATLLSACGPIYRTEYSYQPPKANLANMCISQCIQSKSMCEQMCQMRNENCRERAHQDALFQFEAYKREQRARGERINKSVSDFDQSYRCGMSTSCDCTPAYNACYNSCGGKVIENKICVAFCGK